MSRTPQNRHTNIKDTPTLNCDDMQIAKASQPVNAEAVKL